MRIFLTKSFDRFAKKQEIEDSTLRDAVDRANNGLIDADLGGGVIKQRIARRNKGRSTGFRSIILFRSGKDAFFVYGFAKGKRSNLRQDELEAVKLLADQMFGYNEAKLSKLLDCNELREVKHHGEGIPKRHPRGNP